MQVMSLNELKLLWKLCCSVISVIDEQHSLSGLNIIYKEQNPLPLISVCILFLILCEVIFIAPLETESFIQLCTNAFLVLLSGFKTHQNRMVSSVQKYGLYLLIKLGKKTQQEQGELSLFAMVDSQVLWIFETHPKPFIWEKTNSFSDPPAFLNNAFKQQLTWCNIQRLSLP